MQVVGVGQALHELQLEDEAGLVVGQGVVVLLGWCCCCFGGAGFGRRRRRLHHDDTVEQVEASLCRVCCMCCGKQAM